MADTLSRYRDLAWFLVKYGRSDLVRRAGWMDALEASGSVPRATGAPAPEEVARDLESMGPTFIKLGQLLSTRGDLLPPPYLEGLSRLQDDVEPFPFEEVHAVVQTELGVRVSKAFAAFDPVPLAAASLGQVHRGVLRSGRDVAVKVQRPRIRERIAHDLEALTRAAELFERYSDTGRQIGASAIADEFARTLVAELDYQREARNLSLLAERMVEFDRIIVPLPVEEYTTSRLLTMDFVQGTKITKVSPLVRMDADGSRLADQLFRAYLHQILIDGLFHADPHPGNVFLTDDGRLALLDLGMVGRVSPETQTHLFRLLLALGEGHGDDAATALIALAVRADGFDEGAYRRAVAEAIAAYHSAPLSELKVGRVMLDMVRSGSVHGLRIPPELSLLGKTLLNLDEIGRRLEPDFDVNHSIQRHASDLMRRHLMKSVSPGNVFTSVLEVKEFMAALPGRVNRLLDAVVESELRVKVEVIDQGAILSGLQKVANRIALGLVLAALIVGAAMLMQVSTPFTLFGYPGLAMLLFLAAATGGVLLAVVILRGDIHEARTSAQTPRWSVKGTSSTPHSTGVSPLK